MLKMPYQAEYDKREGGTYSGRIPSCKGVIFLGKTSGECEAELRSTFGDWVIVGLKRGHFLPIIAGYDLNQKPNREARAAV
jgi:predicted RNase H-like HicB family nuclease